MKKTTTYFCTECGSESPKWAGKCPVCGAWNCMVEQKAEKGKGSGKASYTAKLVKALPITELASENEIRFSTGMGELDRVLGGGAVMGSLVLVGGAPGIGKSTLLLQICQTLGQSYRVLYVSGEESTRQLKMRAKRLQVDTPNLLVLSETQLGDVLSCVEQEKPDVLIIDSIQTLYNEDSDGIPGGIGQVKQCTLTLMQLAKSQNITIFVIGHVNKEGAIAGPKVLEHMVDCVLYFEGDKTLPYRVLRAVKNRYGSTNEIGMFDMTGKGLEQIENPSQVMLEGRPIGISGTCVACVMEGTRPVLSEIQALVTKTAFPSPRRTASGFDYNRMYLLLAVLEKRAGYVFGNQDVYINIIGGLKLDETACDLPVCLAMASSLLDLPVPEKTLAIGEVGLGGEVRSVPHLETRLREAQRVGFDTAIVPKHNLNMLDAAQFPGLRLVGVAYLREAINAIKINK
mgnify:CR=1 FL=1